MGNIASILQLDENLDRRFINFDAVPESIHIPTRNMIPYFLWSYQWGNLFVEFFTIYDCFKESRQQWHVLIDDALIKTKFDNLIFIIFTIIKK
jgi:hypothetical protein